MANRDMGLSYHCFTGTSHERLAMKRGNAVRRGRCPMKEVPRLYSNTWMAFVLAVASVLWLGSASTLSGQSGGNSNGRGNGVQGNPGRSGDNPGSSVSSQARSHAAQNIPENAGPGKKKDTLTISPQTSSVDGRSVEPVKPSDEAQQWRYLFCPAGTSLHQTFPVRFQLENTNGTSEESAKILLDAAGRLADDATFSLGFDLVEEFTITDNNAVTTVNVQIDRDDLQDGAYNLNVKIQAWPPRRIRPAHATIRILVLVGSACPAI